jgi:gp16 family phage-associated protein
MKPSTDSIDTDASLRGTKTEVLTKAHFIQAGVSVSSWARSRGFNPRLVFEILRGQRKCLRGESSKIAKELGMK